MLLWVTLGAPCQRMLRRAGSPQQATWPRCWGPGAVCTFRALRLTDGAGQLCALPTMSRPFFLHV